MYMRLIIGDLRGEEVIPTPPQVQREGRESFKVLKIPAVKDKGEEPSGLVRLKACGPRNAGKCLSLDCPRTSAAKLSWKGVGHCVLEMERVWTAMVCV